MSNIFQRFPKPRSSDERPVNLEPDPQNQHRRSVSRLRLPWSFRKPGSTSISPPGGNSPMITRLSTPTPTPQPTTRPPPIAPPPAATPSLSGPPAVLVPVPVPTFASPSVVLPIERIRQRSIGIALEKLREKKLPLLDLNNPTLTSVADISSTVGDLKKTSERGGNGPAVRRLRKVLKTVGSYARIVDRSIQHNPAITALVWAGVRAILQDAMNHIEIPESLEAATETIVAKMAICEFYANVYAETMQVGFTLSRDRMTHSLQQSLDSALPEFCAAILVFSVKARQYFDPSNTATMKTANMLQPFAIEFT